MKYSFKEMVAEATSSGRIVSDSYVIAPQQFTDPVIDTTAHEVPQHTIPKPMSPATTYLPTHSPTPQYNAPRATAYNQAEIWAELQQLLSKWENFAQAKIQSSKKQRIQLAEGDAFSTVVNSALGEHNTSDIYGGYDRYVLTEMFAGLVELEAATQLRNENKYLMCMANLQIAGTYITGELAQDGVFVWQSACEHSGTGFVTLLTFLFNLSRLDALATLAKLVGMNFVNMYQLSSQIHAAESKGTREITNGVPRVVSLLPFKPGEMVAQLVNLYHIVGHAGQSIGAIAVYSLNGKTFCLPATVGNRTLCIGKYKPTAHFLNQDQMDKRPADTVIFCQDMRTALALQRLIEQIASEYRPPVIVTAHLGTDLSVLPWSFFYGHEVVFVCAPNKQSMAKVKVYEAQVLGAGATRFRLFPGFMLHSPAGCNLTCDVAGVTESEAKMLRTAIQMDKIVAPVQQIQRIVEEALSYGDFVLWGQHMGIFAWSKATKRVAHNRTSGLKVFNPNSVAASLQPTTLAEVTLRHILPHAAIVMLHGSKNAGKSYALLEFICALVTGKAAFDLFKNDEVATKVLLADSETPADLFGARLEQLHLHGHVGKSFFPFRKAEATDAVNGAVVLTNPQFTSALEEIIVQHAIKCQFVDNITTFSEDGRAYQQESVGKVLDWAANLNAQGVTTVFAHHSLQDAKNPAHAGMRGSKEFSIRAHTEMVVVGKQQLLEDSALGTKVAQAHARLAGATMGLHFKFCKNASVLEGHTFWFHLPLNSHKFKLLDVTDASGNVVSIESTPLTNGAEEASQSAPPALFGEPTETKESLTAEEQRVLDFVDQNGITQTGLVKDHLGCGDTHARQVLQSLCKIGRLTKTGTGAQQGYMLADKSAM